jgi:hypothetical protein
MPFPVDRKWIAETEAKLGVRFPVSFVASMAKVNGGAVDVGNDVFWLYSFLDGSDRKRIQRTCSSICRETASMRNWEHFQKELIVIGHNSGGDLLVLKPMTDNATILEHSIYVWDHETSEVASVADDFGVLRKV